MTNNDASDLFPELPKLTMKDMENLSLIAGGVTLPQGCIGISNQGEIFVTRNFSDAYPVWKKYKRMGWALRYMNDKS